MIALVEAWGRHYGYYDGKIDLSSGDLNAVTTSDCTLTAHAPLWRTKPGKEKDVPVAEVRKQLATMLKIARVERHDMHIALHPDGQALCVFFVVRGRLPLLPFTVMTVPLAFVVRAIETNGGLRLSEIHEWPAADPAAARRVLVDQSGWPDTTTMEPYMNFGAAS